MTRVWLLTKQSMKGMDLLEVTNDLQYVLEQHEPGKPFSKAEMEQLNRGKNLLQTLRFAVAEQISRHPQKDLYLLGIAEGLEKGLAIPPSVLSTRLEKALTEIQKGSTTSDTVTILELLSDAVIRLTSRSVDDLSTSFH